VGPAGSGLEFGSSARGISHSLSAKRSREDWRPGGPSGRSPMTSAGHRRRSAERSTPTVDDGALGRWSPRRLRASGRVDPRWPSSPAASGYGPKWRPSWPRTGHPEEISGWLARSYPNTPEMYLSHETIYSRSSSRAEAPCAWAPLMTGQKGGRLRRHPLNEAFDDARTALGRPEVHFHDLRHAGRTWAATQGATTAELMRRSGHASPAAALRYQHATEDRDAALAQALSNLAEGTQSSPVRSGARDIRRDGVQPTSQSRSPYKASNRGF
jgi:hypothetical protein